ncbi:NACHT domain-containing protein [Amycolatopsis sp., V23-08]|uniref:NACHT domain-containing protein n=1 Tax=Amycolatopsis heterodermiae TaxID=3110235 RepID=A0ABU5RNP3_9PSEU|nr:NACHT domain-containing protein [Amycolatopsis sp., V23-08]MEA5367189.1 NACHT domain-containing protein [Amycolatopsis sp., V23-08]
MADFPPRAAGRASQAHIAADNFTPGIVDGRLPLPTITHQLPADIPDFTGREDLVAELEDVRPQRPAALVINLFGPPGVGKSALAVHLAHRQSNRFDFELYFDFSTAPDAEPHAAVAQFVAALMPQEPGPFDSPNELRARFLTSTRFGRCLILLDNVQDAAQVRALIPSNEWATVIATSRKPLTTLAGAHLQRVGLLGAAESVALLDTVAGRPPGSEPAAAELAGLCGGLPLAIRIAGAIARKRPYLTYDRLAESLTDERTRLSALSEADLDVRSAFELSYQALSAPAQLAFRRAGLSLTPEFSITDLTALLAQDRATVEKAAYELADAQLAETADGTWFRYHDLIALFARDKAKADDPSDTTDAEQRLAGHVLAEFVTGYRAAAGSTRRLLRRRWQESFAFIPPHAQPYIPQRLTRDAAAVSWRDRLTPGARVLVFGGAGSGKTTLAERICFELATGQPAQLALSVPMRHYRGQDDLVDLVATSVGQRFALRFPRAVLKRLLKEFGTILVLDSLDELPRPARTRAVGAIERFCAKHPAVAMLVTSRPDDKLGQDGIEGFSPYDVAAFTEDEIRTFTKTWLESAGLPDTSAFAPEPSSAAWAANPLLLTWALTHFAGWGRWYENELDLHEATFELTIGERDRSRGITRSSLPRHLLIEAACFLAAWMKSDAERTAGVPRPQLLETVALRVPTHFHTELLDDLSDTIGAIYESGAAPDGEPLYAVVQDTYGEYLAARAVVADAGDDEELAQQVAWMMAVGRFDAGWRYVLDLAERAGRSRPDLLVHLRRAAGRIRDLADRDRVVAMLD